jgi:hypothetical protein
MRLLRALVVLAFLAVAAPAWAAWSFIGCTDGGNVHSMSRSVTAGNLLTTLYINGASGDVPTAADGGVNTWTKIGTTMADTGFNNSLSWWWTSAATTASITVTISSITGADEGMAICEWHSSVANVPANSLETNNQREQNPGVSGADNTTSNSVSAPGSNGDIMLSWSVNVQTGANVETAGTGFTNRFTGTGGNVLRLEEFIQGAAAAKTATWTNSGTNATGTFAAFFKEAATGATLAPQRSLTGAGT